MLEARPKSGFYITSNSTISLSVPSISAPPAKATEVVVLRGVLQLLEFTANDDLIPLGGAIPSTDVLASGRLDRFLARAARKKGTEYNTYTAPHGNINLRNQISHRAMRWGYHLALDDIAITCGCTEAMSLALSAVSKSGDTVLIESPTYFGLLQVLEASGLKALELPTDPENGMDLSALEIALKSHSISACLLSSEHLGRASRTCTA